VPGRRKQGDGSRDQVAGTKPKNPRKQKVVVIRRLLTKEKRGSEDPPRVDRAFFVHTGPGRHLGRNGSLGPASKPARPPASTALVTAVAAHLSLLLSGLSKRSSAVCTASTIAGQQQEPHRWRRKLHPWRRRRRSTIPHCENPPSTTRPAPSSSPTPPPSRRLPPPPSRLTSRATSSQVKRPGLLS
jgi:hypothetical protein